MPGHSFEEIAKELDVSVDDVFVVAESELIDSEFEDEDREYVTDLGRTILIQHFMGGLDPE